MKIPSERIGEIAGTIASGALTGGLTLAGEAIVTSGLGALTTDAIAGSMIGGGVGAAVNNILGGGQISNVLAGIAGGVATRGAISKYRQRQSHQQQAVNETQPLLGGGNTVGGSRSGRSRLVTRNGTNRSEITRIGNDDIEFVPQQPQQSTLSKIKEITSRKAKEATQQMLNIGGQISHGAQNIRQRMSGRSRNDERGAYTSNLANAPEGIDEPVIVGRLSKPEYLEGADEPSRVGTFAKPEEHDAAVVLQGYLKKRPANQAKSMIERDEELKRQAKHAGKPLWQKTIDEARDLNKHEEYMDKLKETVVNAGKIKETRKKNKERYIKLYNECKTPNPNPIVYESIYGPFEPSGVKPKTLSEQKLLPFSNISSIEKTAAMKIQRAVKGKISKTKLENAKTTKSETLNNKAASTLQAAIKRKKSDNVIQNKAFENLIEDDTTAALQKAPSTLQAAIRRKTKKAIIFNH